jgi:hypothetical protein
MASNLICPRTAIAWPLSASPSAFFLLQENAASKKIIAKASRRADQSPAFGRIRCPLCKWRPKPSHRWFCAPCDHPEYFDDGCGTCWNTFSTRGRCPGCGHQWRWTACLSCEGWSLHEDWYEKESNRRQ